jgi:single-strand DNA-binding protein
MINRIAIMGRITKDLELKTTPNGISVVSFSIATDRKYKEKGTDKPASDFFEIVAWRKTAEFICKYFGKGQLIALDGELQTRSYADKNNVNHKVVEIIVNEAHFCGGKNPTVIITLPTGIRVYLTQTTDSRAETGSIRITSLIICLPTSTRLRDRKNLRGLGEEIPPIPPPKSQIIMKGFLQNA